MRKNSSSDGSWSTAFTRRAAEIRRHPEFHPLRRELGLVHAGLGNADAFFRSVESSIEERNALALLLNCLCFDRFRSDPRFDELIRKVGLPQ